MGDGAVWGDLDRPRLSAARLSRALRDDGYDLQVVERTASTNADLVTAAAAGAAEGTVLVAESQQAGRGRLGRSWTSPPRAGLTYSILLRPPAPSGWLPLLAGLSVVMALREHAGVDAALKWPNDVVLIEGGEAEGGEAEGGAAESSAGESAAVERKVAGILAEVAGDAVVIGIGLNVTTRAEEFAGLPPASLDPTSLALAGARTTDRETVLKAQLRAFSRAYAAWRSDPGSVAPLYRSVCRTLGRNVRLELPGGRTVPGVATDVDDQGRLVLSDPAGVAHAFAAGDVVHLR
jgi:BirA family transcriptional regulator, biotin operon repressor / biotin---[acetyl-CoA-carboxylase] ligase